MTFAINFHTVDSKYLQIGNVNYIIKTCVIFVATVSIHAGSTSFFF
ncbi:Hypothetical protein LOCK900_1914 [Lacticaseibacillus rhamnosus LOCK900]|nr:Hypothetical protein LOCK900_1914 [Lacticaseibacillus rhamnosus LOCK900]